MKVKSISSKVETDFCLIKKSAFHFPEFSRILLFTSHVVRDYNNIIEHVFDFDTLRTICFWYMRLYV